MMKHPDTVKAAECRTKARAAEDDAADFGQQALQLQGVAPALAMAYAAAATALDALAAALNERAEYFEESARLTT